MAIEDDNINSGDSSKKSIGTSSNLNLSFGDSLYLYPNDTGGPPIGTVKLTDTENYKIWSIAMTFALRNHNKLGFINGTCKKYDSNSALANQWEMCNSVMFTWILNSLSFQLYTDAVYAKSTYELWNDLKDTYDKVDGSVVFNLHKSINSLSQSGASLANYSNNLNSLWKQFDAMISLHPCTCEAAKHFEIHNQLLKLMRFLMGLDDSYFAIRSNILTRDPIPLVKAAFAIVSGEESQRNINSVGTTKPTATAFATKTFDKKKVKKNFIPNTRPMSSNNTSSDIPSNNTSSSTTSNSLVSLSNEQLARLMNLLNDNGVLTANVNIYFNGNTNFVVGNISWGWIVDSRANQHMTVSTKILVNVIDISNLGLTVVHPNGTQALITKIGDLKINNDITLYDVLVVPEYTANRSVGIGRQYNGLYLFDVDNAFLDVLKTTLSLDRHSTSNHLCDTCNKAKQIREPFPLSDHKSIKIGRVSSNNDGIELSPDNQGNDDSEATSIDETNNTHPEDNVSNETNFINDFYENSEFNSKIEE
ncbi:ribonuclease H-like domain-containing protein [Tanacetum coccineum]